MDVVWQVWNAIIFISCRLFLNIVNDLKVQKDIVLSLIILVIKNQATHFSGAFGAFSWLFAAIGLMHKILQGSWHTYAHISTFCSFWGLV